MNEFALNFKEIKLTYLDIINVIASLIAISGGLFTFIKFVLRPYLKKLSIINRIKVNYGHWQSVRFVFRGNSLLKKEGFSEINSYRAKLSKLKKNILAYLLMNSIQLGMGGEWGEWLKVNKDNPHIIPVLLLALNGKSGNRPKWRSMYILENIFKDDAHFISEAFRIINDKGVENYLREYSLETEGEQKKKIEMVIDEINTFSKQTSDFASNQTITKT